MFIILILLWVLLSLINTEFYSRKTIPSQQNHQSLNQKQDLIGVVYQPKAGSLTDQRRPYTEIYNKPPYLIDFV